MDGTTMVLGGVALALGAGWLLQRKDAPTSGPRVPPVPPPLGEPGPPPPTSRPQGPLESPTGEMTVVLSTNDPGNIRLTIMGDWAVRRNAVLRARARSSALEGHVTRADDDLRPGDVDLHFDRPAGVGRWITMSVAEFRRNMPVPPKPGTRVTLTYSLFPPEGTQEQRARYALVRNEIARDLASKGWAIYVDPRATV